MPDFGTLIADSRGVLHDVSKHGFDALRGALSKPLNTSDSILTDSFQQTFSNFKESLASKYGLDPEEGLSLENIAEQLREQLFTTGGRMEAAL